MASMRRKSAAVALAVVGVAGLSLASAAQLNVGSETLQAGAVSVGTCDPDGVEVSYENAFSGGVYKATNVAVSGIHSDCVGGNIKMTLSWGSTAADTREFSGLVDGDTFTPSFGTPISAEHLANVAIVITK